MRSVRNRMSYRAQQSEMVSFQGHKGDKGEAYYSRPSGAGKFPGVLVIHHLPGWDEWIMEVTRKFAHHGYAAIAPHLYFREGSGSPDDIGARVRRAGALPISSPAAWEASTRWSTAGAATWSSTTRSSSTPKSRSRRSTSRTT